MARPRQCDGRVEARELARLCQLARPLTTRPGRQRKRSGESSPAPGTLPAGRDVTTSLRRVLIVEDGLDARESLRLLLEHAGHVVETAEDGATGLAKLHAFRPDVALIDIGLPGLDGYAVARQLLVVSL